MAELEFNPGSLAPEALYLTMACTQGILETRNLHSFKKEKKFHYNMILSRAFSHVSQIFQVIFYCVTFID